MKIISECHDKDNGFNYHDDSKMSGYCCMLHKHTGVLVVLRLSSLKIFIIRLNRYHDGFTIPNFYGATWAILCYLEIKLPAKSLATPTGLLPTKLNCVCTLHPSYFEITKYLIQYGLCLLLAP